MNKYMKFFCAALAAAVMLCLTSCKGEDAGGTVGADGTVNAASDDRSSELTGEWRFDASELTATELAALCAKLTAEGGTDVSALSELLERNFDRAPAEKLYGSMVFRFENDGTATGRLYPEAYAEGYAEILRATFTAMGDLGLEEAASLTGTTAESLEKMLNGETWKEYCDRIADSRSEAAAKGLTADAIASVFGGKAAADGTVVFLGPVKFTFDGENLTLRELSVGVVSETETLRFVRVSGNADGGSQELIKNGVVLRKVG